MLSKVEEPRSLHGLRFHLHDLLPEEGFSGPKTFTHAIGYSSGWWANRENYSNLVLLTQQIKIRLSEKIEQPDIQDEVQPRPNGGDREE